MAKVLLKAGAEFDILSSEEHSRHMERMKQDFMDYMRQMEGEVVVRSAGSFLTDATGGTKGLPNGGGGIYRVPVGFDGFLTRLSVDYEGSNASALVSCDLRVVADQNTPASLRSLVGDIPNVFYAGKSHAPLFRGGQLVVVCLTGGPATTAIYCTAQVLLTKRRHISADVLE